MTAMTADQFTERVIGLRRKHLALIAEAEQKDARAVALAEELRPLLEKSGSGVAYSLRQAFNEGAYVRPRELIDAGHAIRARGNAASEMQALFSEFMGWPR